MFIEKKYKTYNNYDYNNYDCWLPNFANIFSIKSVFNRWCFLWSRSSLRMASILPRFEGMFVENEKSTSELLLVSPSTNSDISYRMYPSRSSSTIILCNMIHALIMLLIFSFSQRRAGFLTIAKRACKTPNARSTSFLAASWRSANNTSFGPWGIEMDWIKVGHFGYIPSVR